MTTGPVKSDVDHQVWLTVRVARLAGRASGDIDPEAPIAGYGLDSVSALGLLAEVEDELGIELDPADLWDYPSVRALGDRITELAAGHS